MFCGHGAEEKLWDLTWSCCIGAGWGVFESRDEWACVEQWCGFVAQLKIETSKLGLNDAVLIRVVKCFRRVTSHPC